MGQPKVLCCSQWRYFEPGDNWAFIKASQNAADLAMSQVLEMFAHPILRIGVDIPLLARSHLADR
jgi:hypothetical protein